MFSFLSPISAPVFQVPLLPFLSIYHFSGGFTFKSFYSVYYDHLRLCLCPALIPGFSVDWLISLWSVHLLLDKSCFAHKRCIYVILAQ